MKTPSSVFSKRSLAIHPIFVHGQVCNLHAKGGSNPILPRYQKIWKMSTPARRRRVLCRRHPSNIDPRRIASNPAPQGVCGHQQWGSQSRATGSAQKTGRALKQRLTSYRLDCQYDGSAIGLVTVFGLCPTLSSTSTSTAAYNCVVAVVVCLFGCLNLLELLGWGLGDRGHG